MYFNYQNTQFPLLQTEPRKLYEFDSKEPLFVILLKARQNLKSFQDSEKPYPPIEIQNLPLGCNPK